MGRVVRVQYLLGLQRFGMRTIEAIVLEQYCLQNVSQGKLAEILGLSRWEAEEFLDKHNARHPYTREMIEEDRRTLANLPRK